MRIDSKWLAKKIFWYPNNFKTLIKTVNKSFKVPEIIIVTNNNIKFRAAKQPFTRSNLLKRDDFTCQLCGKRGGTMNADHIKPFAYFPELRTSIENGRTLCEPCHRKTDTFGYKANK